jgi:hypothetical protein
MLSSLLLVLHVDALAGDKHNVVHATEGLWRFLGNPGVTSARRSGQLRGDKSWGIERVLTDGV